MSLIPQYTLFFGDEPFDPFLSMVNKCPVLNAPTDWKETPEAHLFITDLPGLTKEEVKVEIDEHDRVLKISGERKVGDDYEEEEEKLGRWHRAERFRGKFLRRFKLPENAKTDNGVIRASMEDGVLTVTVPKEEVKKQPQVKRIIEIEENGNK